MNGTIQNMAERAKMAVIVKCIELNYIETGRWQEIPPNEVLAVMANGIYEACADLETRDVRAWFFEVSKWKAENGKNPIVGLPDLAYARARWSRSSVPTPKGCAMLPSPKDTALATLPQVVQLRDEMQRLKLTHQAK